MNVRAMLEVEVFLASALTSVCLPSSVTFGHFSLGSFLS